MKRFLFCFVLSIMLTAIDSACAADTYYSVGFRSWYPRWTTGPEDLGRGRLDSVSASAGKGNLAVAAMVGIGGGWDAVELTRRSTPDTPVRVNTQPIDQRFDHYGQVTYDAYRAFIAESLGGYFSRIGLPVGLGYHYFGFKSRLAETTWHGPLATGALALPIPGAMLGENALPTVLLQGGYYPVMWVDAEGTAGNTARLFEVKNLETDAYYYDFSLSLRIHQRYDFRVGYRAVIVRPLTSSSQRVLREAGLLDDFNISGEDVLKGWYAQFALNW